MDKQKYYVSLTSSEISQIPFGNNDDFIIYAAEDDVRMLRQALDQMHDADMGTFWRAHVPIKPYHQDEANDSHDHQLNKAFQMIYNLGDDETKANLRDMGVLTDKHM